MIAQYFLSFREGLVKMIKGNVFDLTSNGNIAFAFSTRPLGIFFF